VCRRGAVAPRQNNGWHCLGVALRPIIFAMTDVFVVLPTYNAGPYLAPLLDSIRRQSFTDWTLLVRDDGSSDGTWPQLKDVASDDSRIVPLAPGPRLGPAAGFGLLADVAYGRGAQYLFFADQDDVWHRDKLEKMLEQIRREEMSGGSRSPHLAYSDLIVVDSEMRTVHPSFLTYSRLRHGEGRPLRTLLGRSFVLGCACVVNRPLLEFALPMPERVASHDWWVALCAAAIGGISYFPEPTLWYRRHGRNASGPAGFWSGFNPLQHSWSRRWQVGWRSFVRSVEQAVALRDRIRSRSPAGANDALALLDDFCGLFNQSLSGWRRVRGLRQIGTPAIDLPRRLLYYLCALKRLPAAIGESQPVEVPRQRHAA
jgi:rhamnosyltransferase